MKKNGVNIIGYYQGQFGLAETGRLFVSALETTSTPYCLLSADFAVVDQTFRPYGRPVENTPKYDVNLFCIDADSLMSVVQKYGHDILRNHYNIALFFWETNVVPSSRLRFLSYFDEIWVASEYIQKTLSSSKSLRATVRKIPHPFMENTIVSDARKSSFGLADKFTFLFCFDMNSSIKRKNPEAIIEAFRRAFGDRDDVQLVIKSHNAKYHPESFQNALKGIQRDPRIHWIDECMEGEKRFALMKASDCYISLHRSEGLGMTMAESMMLGKPVIATRYSGNLDFMTPDNSFLCDSTLIPIGKGNHHYSGFGEWADVNVDDAAHWMRYVVNNPKEAAAKANKGREDLLRKHSLSAVGTMMEGRLHQIVKEWNPTVPSPNQRYLQIRCLRDRITLKCDKLLRHYGGAVKRRLKKWKRTFRGERD